MSSDRRAFKLKLLLAIDTAFLFLELGVGTAVGSLALVADSFHMPRLTHTRWVTNRLNDVISLVVALQALKLAGKSSASSQLSYGWQRAEVLGALINGVFLLALCFSIGMEAIARFVNYTAEVTNPQLITVVGCAGLVSNIVGLFLFHDHGGHSHGGGGGGHGHGHSHGGGGGAHKAHAHSHADVEADAEAPRRPARSSGSGSGERSPLLSAQAPARARAADRASSPAGSSTAVGVPSDRGSGASSSAASSDAEDEDDEAQAEDELYCHPGEMRANVLKKAHNAGYGTVLTGGAAGGAGAVEGDGVDGTDGHDGHALEGGREDVGGHAGHGGHGGHGGNDGAMNMQGVFLHVLGDALGNVGVIAAGLFIWLTDYSWRMYTDPGISLVITIIIFSSALPLVKSASFILLQGVPSSVPLERLRSSIAAVPGVINVHDLHVWSLSESKIVASVHIMVHSRNLVSVSREIKQRFHRFGIHSSTIQPEIRGLETEGCPVLCAEGAACADNQCCPPTTGSRAGSVGGGGGVGTSRAGSPH
ncbi:cation efflux protein [Rhodotorula diobovata]|uniref:Cation efflux protein n=1 Tax=Rhodotorula diobovata TaxID=5288 RepID=A0A5C5FPG5_9BASI|nr:cation efflux protein [Rhodotorula diobovata]TNY17691.1 cation efflux protein [Rhodotorula diobovata]